MLIIGFGNKARHGKDTAALAIQDYFMGKRDEQELHGLKMTAPYVQRVGFADALYETCKRDYGMVNKDAELLQRVGSNYRKVDPLYWVHRAFANINLRADIVVIPDVRYWNEAVFIKNEGGYLINVSRLNPDGTPFVASDRPADHLSETELDTWNWDFKLVMSHGHQALLGDLAITTAAYLWGLHNDHSTKADRRF